jgi:hypothetical protein
MMTFMAQLAESTRVQRPIMVRKAHPAQWFSPDIVDAVPSAGGTAGGPIIYL